MDQEIMRSNRWNFLLAYG